MKTIKQLRAQKRSLEAAARDKFAELIEGMDAEEAKAIETEHKRMLDEISEIDVEIRALKKKEERSTKTKKEIDDQAHDESERAQDEDEDDEDDDDDDEKEEMEDDKDEEKKDKRKKRNLQVLTRSQMAELVTIDTQARGLGIDLKLAEAIEKGTKPDMLRKRLFNELAKRSERRGPTGGGNDVVILRDEREGVKESMELALISRVLSSRGNDGIEYKPKDRFEKDRVEHYRKQSEQYMHMGLVDVAAACIGFRGRGSYLTHRDVDDILTRAFQSTSDFPSIFQNVLNKSLLARYELATPTYRRIAAQRNFNDFRPHPQIRAGEFPALQPVNETGEIQYGTSVDNNETVSVKAYGVIFTISRVMLVNDDLAAIDQILGSAGDTVLVFENTTFFQMFNSNPTLNQDNTAVFASTHNNYVASGSGAAPSVTTIGAGRAAMRAQKSLSNLYLNIPPRIILTGPLQETAADQMVASITPTLTTSVNPFSGRLESVSDANITTNQWYMVADPLRLPNFVYGFLNGSTGPRTRTFEPFGVQGVKISLEHDFGVGAIDFRGIYENFGQ